CFLHPSSYVFSTFTLSYSFFAFLASSKDSSSSPFSALIYKTYGSTSDVSESFIPNQPSGLFCVILLYSGPSNRKISLSLPSPSSFILKLTFLVVSPLSVCKIVLAGLGYIFNCSLSP